MLDDFFQIDSGTVPSYQDTHSHFLKRSSLAT